MDNNKQAINIEYTNYRGERGIRKILPLKIWFGATQWHSDEQWLLKAIDIEKGVERDFALRDIHNFIL